jgi:hypothetical protein
MHSLVWEDNCAAFMIHLWLWSSVLHPFLVVVLNIAYIIIPNPLILPKLVFPHHSWLWYFRDGKGPCHPYCTWSMIWSKSGMVPPIGSAQLKCSRSVTSSLPSFLGMQTTF